MGYIMRIKIFGLAIGFESKSLGAAVVGVAQSRVVGGRKVWYERIFLQANVSLVLWMWCLAEVIDAFPSRRMPHNICVCILSYPRKSTIF